MGVATIKAHCCGHAVIRKVAWSRTRTHSPQKTKQLAALASVLEDASLRAALLDLDPLQPRREDLLPLFAPFPFRTLCWPLLRNLLLPGSGRSKQLHCEKEAALVAIIWGLVRPALGLLPQAVEPEFLR